MNIRFLNSINEVSASEWDALWPTSYPFTRHAFLLALETSNSTNKESGWQVQHLVAHENDTLVFAMPLYLKTHSYGEYVFDWGWADAYARYGMEYYPKLLNAIPFTPATGPRWACAQGWEDNLETLFETLIQRATQNNISSLHCLFPCQKTKKIFAENSNYIPRQGCQFHWFNQNFRNFDHYLESFSSRKRKNIRKERKKCEDFDIVFLDGHQANAEDWELFYQLYHRTYLKRSGRAGYLGRSFFSALAQSMPENILLAQAKHKGDPIAGAIYFRDDECLYGRYWGTKMDIDGLHFETCYYRGIEYAIEHGLSRFDPGAQGEHKIQRGFQSVETCSYHWIADSQFRTAITDFCESEAKHNAHYVSDARTYLPFKEGVETVAPNILTAD